MISSQRKYLNLDTNSPDWFPFICLNNEMREFVWGYSISSRRSLYLLATLYRLLREVSPGVLFLCRIPPSPAQLEKNVMSNWREMIKVSRGIIANSGLNFFAALRPKTSVPAFQKKRWWTNRWLFSPASESNRQFEGNSCKTLAQYSPVSQIVGVGRSNTPYKLAASVCVEDLI